MALRTYYDTQIKIYNLLNSHPVLNNMLQEFNIDIDNVKNVALYLLENHDIISSSPLTEIYNYSEMIQEAGELYGFFPPFENQVSQAGTPLLELLNFTFYIYKFGTTDNFYEKHILDFLPEYDREYIQNEPKLKLLYESIGRKFDDIELKLSQMKNIYDIDEVPENLLDYLGQNIGYEKEDYTLQNVSFREFLKNIIEIYKIKGTNYSFSFFFKFLGFEISLKEFFFNRDVKNPEGFPGVEKNKVEYYLSTKNPIFDISNNKPAKNLGKTKNINDWELELESLESKGCSNSINYMLGLEMFNNNLDDVIWHSNPWTYFKTNLIEYELEALSERLNLTASDNETIRKYVKFLSPTYLFTWINVNLKPWTDDINIVTDPLNDWIVSISTKLGDPRPTAEPWPYAKKTSASPGFNGFNNDGIYYDYEPLGEILKIYKADGEELVFSVYNNMNLGGEEVLGTTLKRDGVYIRQPGHPKFISNITHQGDKKISFDFMGIEIRDYIDESATTQVNYYSNLPTTGINNEEIYYVRYPSNGYAYGYYKFFISIGEWRYISYDDYSYRSYPATPVNPSPDNNQTLSNSNLPYFSWEEIKGSYGYWIQVATDSKFTNIILNIDNLVENYYAVINRLSNNRYYWRIKVKNSSTFPGLPLDNPIINIIDNYIWSLWSDQWQFTLSALPFPYNGEIINKKTLFIKENRFTSEFLNIDFNLIWQVIPSSKKYRVQILENVPYIWSIREGIWSYQTYSTLPVDKTINTSAYVIEEEKFYIWKSIEQGWVQVPQQATFSVADTFSDIPTTEQKIGDVWYILDTRIYYMWQSIVNNWEETDEMFGVLGNISNRDNLLNLIRPLYSIYFVQAENEFYQYIPIELSNESQTAIVKYDSVVGENRLSVQLENGKYYWRIKSYVSDWQDWGELYEFTVNFT